MFSHLLGYIGLTIWYTPQLHELLRQDSSLVPSLTPSLPKPSGKQSLTNWGRLVDGLYTLSWGRAGKNISLVLVSFPRSTYLPSRFILSIYILVPHQSSF